MAIIFKRTLHVARVALSAFLFLLVLFAGGLWIRSYYANDRINRSWSGSWHEDAVWSGDEMRTFHKVRREVDGDWQLESGRGILTFTRNRWTRSYYSDHPPPAEAFRITWSYAATASSLIFPLSAPDYWISASIPHRFGNFTAWSFGPAPGGVNSAGDYEDITNIQQDEGYTVPLWGVFLPLVVGFAAIVGPSANRNRRSVRRRKMGLCPACGYDLRASPGRCP